jgi:hypothetical protein
MKYRPITSIDILKFVDGEYRSAAREVFELHGLEISERAEKFRCIPEVVYKADDAFSFRENPSKFRMGDYVLLNPHKSDMVGDKILEGGGYVITGLDEEKKVLELQEPGYSWTSGFSPHRNEKCIIDVPLASRFPLFTYPAWASGYLHTSNAPGPIIQEILKGRYKDKTLKGPYPDPPGVLLKSQKKAFRHAMGHRLSLIQGPPGTGKTFLIAHIVEAMAKMGLRVFVCSFSHRAINNALNTCVRKTSLPDVSKLGGAYSNDDLDERVVRGEDSGVVGMTAFEAFKTRARSIRGHVKEFRHTRPEPARVRDDNYWRKMDDYTQAVFEAGIESYGPEYDAIVFDEASQILMHHALMAMPLARRYVLVGDHKQMPPVVQGFHKGSPANQSVFSLLMAYYPELNTILDETRRMNKAITAFPSAEYYDNRLKPVPEVMERKLEIQNLPDDKLLASIVDPDAPVVFVHVDHDGYSQESPEEASLVARIVFELVCSCGIDPKDGLCVVAAHRRQNNLIRQHIAEIAKREKIKGKMARKLFSPDLVIDTVERIQGQERDAVVVSLTASDEQHIKSEKDFLMMPNRMNVSFTRPRSKLIVVGSKKMFRIVPADRDEQYEDVVSGRKVFRSKGVTLTNHFKRWYFHVKERQRIVEGTALVE